MPHRPHSAWATELSRRARCLFLLKGAGITAFTWLFFLAYFHLLRFPAYPVREMPLTALDRWVPFEPTALVAYFSLWLYVGIAPGLQPNLRALIAYGGWAAALSATGLALFYFWPTRIPPLPAVETTFPGFAVLQGVDAAGNACPSMHVAIATFSAIWLDRIFRDTGAPWPFRLANAAWCAAIAWSTLAIRQHVVLDAAAGAALGGAFAAASLYWQSRLVPAGRLAIIRPADGVARTAPADGSVREISHPGAP